MAKGKEPVGWFTRNGVHVPIYENEQSSVAKSKQDIKHAKKSNKKLNERDLKRLKVGDIVWVKQTSKSNFGNKEAAYEVRQSPWGKSKELHNSKSGTVYQLEDVIAGKSGDNNLTAYSVTFEERITDNYKQLSKSGSPKGRPRRTHR